MEIGKSDPNREDHLDELLQVLLQLGRDAPMLLIHLAKMLQPALTDESVIPTLQIMFREIPSLEYNQLEELKQSESGGFVPLFFQFVELSMLLHRVSHLQLLHLNHNLVPVGNISDQLNFMVSLQELFQAWGAEKVYKYHQLIAETPLHMEVQQLLLMEPSISWDLLHVVIELLKLPTEELTNFREWITTIPKTQLYILIQLLQVEAAAVLELKQRFTFPDIYSHIAQSHPNADMQESVTNISQQPQLAENQRLASLPQEQITSDTGYRLKIIREPPQQTVYQRIVKPFPAVMLLNNASNSKYPENNLFVEATLLRSDTETEISQCLNGTHLESLSSNNIATFKKLKILATSVKEGCLFKLKFSLKRYRRDHFENISTVVVISNPIEVFSHTCYITKPKDSLPPPIMEEILPPYGKPGTRVCILGSNFINTPKLTVCFGDYQVKPIFHEQGTLICTVPDISGITQMVVQASNDGVHFSEANVKFTCFPHK